MEAFSGTRVSVSNVKRVQRVLEEGPTPTVRSASPPGGLWPQSCPSAWPMRRVTAGAKRGLAAHDLANGFATTGRRWGTKTRVGHQRKTPCPALSTPRPAGLCCHPQVGP